MSHAHADNLTQSNEPLDDHPTDKSAGPPSSVVEKPRSKRIACIACRGRKLKCDGNRPQCASCVHRNHSCSYEESRRKSGPKRGYVKALEDRLRQVESLLGEKSDTTKESTDAVNEACEVPGTSFVVTAGGHDAGDTPILTRFDTTGPSVNAVASTNEEGRQWSPQLFQDGVSLGAMGDAGFKITASAGMDLNMDMDTNDFQFTWEMIGLGIDEPLPPQDTIDELHDVYFNKIHPSLPMIHRSRYLAVMNLAPAQRPPICLRYAMWAIASSATDRFSDLKEHFYQRSKKYMERDVAKGHGESMVSLAHCQTHILLSAYEFKMMFFPRAWMSTGQASRLAQMMGLHRLDGEGLDIKQCLPPPRDWVEREERRRTFWLAFCEDRYASIGTGWPMTFDEKDIMTNLPASDEAYESGIPEHTQNLEEALACSASRGLSSFAGVSLLACIFGRNLLHLHRPDANTSGDRDMNGEFWTRHRNMDNILLNISLNLPWHLRLPAGIASPNIVFTNMNIHTATICLHQAAIFKADKNKLPASVCRESKIRCLTAANEIAGIMKMIAHLDLDRFNSFMCFCLYVAARVFVQYLKSQPEDTTSAEHLRFILQAMNIMKRRNPLAESFLFQLDLDLEYLKSKNPKFMNLIQSARGFDAMQERSEGCLRLNTEPGMIHLEVPGRIPYIYAESSEVLSEDNVAPSCAHTSYFKHSGNREVQDHGVSAVTEDLTWTSGTTPSSASARPLTFEKLHPVSSIVVNDPDMNSMLPAGANIAMGNWELNDSLGTDDMMTRMMMGIDPVWN